ncbi:MAG: acylphosphatase [Bacteroidia bacterium]
MAHKHYNITVKGHVQGVSYRFSAHAEALRLGLTGFVKNLSNGDVYLEAEGTDENLSKMIAWCQIGPPRAEVMEVNAVEGELKHFPTFEIKR